MHIRWIFVEKELKINFLNLVPVLEVLSFHIWA